MRIVIVSNTAWYLVNFRSGIIRALVQAGHDVWAIAPKDDYVSQIKLLGARYISIDIDNKGLNPVRDVRTFFDFLRLYRRYKFDFAFHFTIKPVIYGGLSARILGIPYVSTITGLGTVFIKEAPVTHIVEFLYRISQSKARIVLFQNHDDRNLFIERNMISDSNSDVIAAGSGVDVDYFRATEAPQIALPEKKELIFLLISRMLWDKGIGEYVSAARMVKSQYPNVRFQLLGFLDVSNRTVVPHETLGSWVSEGVVEYLGSADDVRPFIETSDCVVLPSYREGVPRSLLEAASMGKPLIASDVTGCREVVDHGVNGFLCAPRDSADLADKLAAFIDLSPSEKMAMSRASRLKIEKTFDENIVISRYMELIEEYCC